MDLFATISPASSVALTDKYRPQAIAEFIGLDKPRKLAAKIAANPPQSTNGGCYLFTGGPGLGKTTLRSVVSTCHYVPKQGFKRHVILIDEADQMTPAAQMYLLSKMDATAAIPDTIIILTANDTERLHERFLSRCLHIPFSAHGQSTQTASLLERVWDAEAPATAARPNFARIVKEACNNVRASLMALQTEILLAD